MAKNSRETNELVEKILSLKSKANVSDFLRSILTAKELDEISKRLQIVKMLKLGTPHHKIAHDLKVGVATVTRGSKELQRGHFKNI